MAQWAHKWIESDWLRILPYRTDKSLDKRAHLVHVSELKIGHKTKKYELPFAVARA